MRIIADESCDYLVVRGLRAAGHEVLAIAEFSPRLEDSQVLDLATKEETLLITEDKDFGQLVYADQKVTAGVILIRFPARARTELAKAVLQLLQVRGNHLLGRFVVLQPGRVRIRPG